MSPAREPVLVLGGSSGIGRAVAAELARAGHALVVTGRDAAEAESVAADLRVRYAVEARGVPAEVRHAVAHEALVDRLLAGAPAGPFGVVMCVGYTGEQARGQTDPVERARILETNFTGPVGVLERLAAELEARGGGWICVVSSVSGDRGRASNYLYGSAKAGLSVYVEGLRHRLFAKGIPVTLVKPGFVDTGMTWGLPGVRGAAAPERVARGILRAVDRRRDTVYLPGIWRLLMVLIRALPGWIFKRLRL